MPQLPSERPEGAESPWDWDFEDIRHGAYNAWDSFQNFALRDNVLEVAVGLMYVQ
jgi:hypothetical protein